MAAASAVVTLATDTFNRVAAALVTASDGGTWTTVGAWNTNGTQATCAVPSASAVRNVGQSNYTMSCKVVTKVGANATFRWRYTDASNCFGFQVNDATSWYIRSTVAGVDTNYFADLITIADGDTIAIVVSGTSHIFKRNGTTVLTKTYTELATGPSCGLSTAPSLAGTAVFDDFVVTSP